MTITTFIHADLIVSPLNVRFNESDANAVEALSASIVAEGLLQPLIVHPIPDGVDWREKAGKPDADFAALAGGRRYRAIRLAIANGDLPANFPIAAEVRELTDAQIVLLSLSENLLRRDLQGYEVHAAIARLHALDMQPPEIARQLGQSEEWVVQQMRLGELDPPIFHAYCKGDLSIDQARAFAATEDHHLQHAAWEHFSRKQSWDRTPEKIRAFYKVGDHELSRLLRFVGETAYREAGGLFELDLFASEAEHRGRVADEAILRTLAERKLEDTRTRIREQAQRRDLRFASHPPQHAGYNDTSLEIHVDTPADLPRDIADADLLATLEIAASGTAIIRFWWASRRAKAQAGKPGSTTSTAQTCSTADLCADNVIGQSGTYDERQARAAVRDEYGLTADGLQAVRSMRRDLLRSVLLQDAAVGGNLARDYLTFALLRQELGDDQPAQAGLRSFSTNWAARDDEPIELVRPWREDQLAGQLWKRIVEDLLAQPFMTMEDPAEAFELFTALDEDAKSRASAVCVGLALIRSANAPGWRVPVHDKLAELAGADPAQLRRFWKPTPAFAGLFPKMKRLELAQPRVEPSAFSSWPKLDDKVLTASTAHVLQEDAGWVHPLLAFNVGEADALQVDGNAEMEPAG